MPFADDPTDLDEAVRAGAFTGLRKAIRDLGETGTIATIAGSGLRGRGGGGFPAADKWRIAATTPAARRYVVVNGYGADPATATDRTLLERDPFAVIEGATIAAYAIGATEVIIAVRAEATEAIRTLEAAIGAASDAGFLGFGILGSAHDIAMTVRPVQGAYMLGEETVLLKALEGRRGQPEQRPPYPAERGLDGMPTVVHNVQTLASVPWIIRHGADAFAATGAPKSPGRSSSRFARPPGTASRRCLSGHRCAISRALPATCRAVGASRPSSSAGRPAVSCPPSSSTRRTPSPPCVLPAPISALDR